MAMARSVNKIGEMARDLILEILGWATREQLIVC